MSISSTYFLNGPSLGSSTAIFLDDQLTILASDGFYSDGVISREQVGGILLPQQICPSCGVDCDGETNIDTVPERISFINSTLNTNVGVVAVKIIKDAYNNQSGIQVEYDGIIYNKIVSPLYGVLQAPSNLPTFIGTIDEACNLVAGSPYTLERYNWYSGAWVDLLSTQNVSIAYSQDKTTILPPGECYIIVPKPPTGGNAMTITCIDPCVSSSVTIVAACPRALFPYSSNIMAQDESFLACVQDDTEITYWFFNTTGDNTELLLFDCVFSDQYGQSPLPDGWYKGFAPTQSSVVFLVENGVIVAFEECAVGDCFEYTAECVAPNESASITYIGCGGGPEVTIIVSLGTPQTFCAIYGTINNEPDSLITINGFCPSL